MKKRLRKKLGIGEFYAPWFAFSAELNPMGEGDQAAFVERFINAAEANGLFCDGSISPEDIMVYVETGLEDGKNAERREKFLAAIKDWPEFKSIDASELE